MWPDHDAALVERVREVTRLAGTSRGDDGVLATAHWQVTKTTEALLAAGIPVVALYRYDGRPADAVKVRAVKRAKGLEFERVQPAEVEPTLLTSGPESTSETDRGRHDLGRRELYVPMTRRGDGLWVGVRATQANYLWQIRRHPCSPPSERSERSKANTSFNLKTQFLICSAQK